VKPFLVKYKSRVVNVDFIDVAGERYWGHEIYPEADPNRGWYFIDLCAKVCDTVAEGKREPQNKRKNDGMPLV